MNAFTIKDLENLSGIKAHTIRIWEQRYSLLSPQRTDTNIRYYSNTELKTVLNIALLNKYGFKISHIDKMSAGTIKEKILSLSHSDAQQERMVNELIGFMVEMDVDAFESTLNKYIEDKGIEKCIIQIIFPFLSRVGILWLTNHINPGQEHLVTNLIRNKLVVGLEAVPTNLNCKNTALLFLPEGEHHELGILFACYLLKSRGVRVVYVGSNIPLKDIEFIARFKKPDFLYSHLTSVANNFNFEKFLINVHQKIPDLPVVISGLLTQNYKKKLPENISLKKSLAEVMDYISAL
jgi:DNA-binding transcriptional MerR regulator